MKRDWLERFIQIGTSEMYGSVEHATTEDEPIKPSSPYAASKVAFDMYLVSVHKFLKFPMNIIRPSNAYCPGQLLHRVIPKAVVCGLKGEKLPLHGGGRAEKSYIHARDLGRAIHLVAEKAPLGRVYNAGPALPTSIREVVERTAKALGVPFDQLCEVTGDRLGQDSRYWLDSSAHQARRRLGAADRLGRGLGGDGRLGPQVFRRAENLADRLHVACVRKRAWTRVSQSSDATASISRRRASAASAIAAAFSTFRSRSARCTSHRPFPAPK